MSKKSNLSALSRVVGVVASVIILASGVTYAALQSPPIKLTGNTIETASANLAISADGISFASSKAGYLFNNIIPGGSAVPVDGYPLYLKNAGAINLNLKLFVSSTPANPNNVDLTKVSVILTPVGFSSGPPQTFTLDQLISAGSTGGIALTNPAILFAGNTQQFSIKVSMSADAVSNQSASLSNIEFAFVGQAVIN